MIPRLPHRPSPRRVLAATLVAGLFVAGLTLGPNLVPTGEALALGRDLDPGGVALALGPMLDPNGVALA